MQIAKGIVVAHVHNQQHVTGVTPAELLIYHAMHFKESNGSPLKEFVIMPGEAETVEIEAISAKPGYLMAGERGMIPVEPVEAVPAKTHKRTNAEEITRLKKKFTGTIRMEDGSNKPGFEAVFGSARIITLPQKFAEVADLVGIDIAEAKEEADGPGELELHRAELMRMKRTELVEIAIKEFKLKVAPGDSKEAIVDGIMSAEADAAKAAAAEAAKAAEGEKTGE